MLKLVRLSHAARPGTRDQTPIVYYGTGTET